MAAQPRHNFEAMRDDEGGRSESGSAGMKHECPENDHERPESESDRQENAHDRNAPGGEGDDSGYI